MIKFFGVICMNIIKRILISFVFDFLWSQIISFLRVKVRKTKTKYDDKFIDWIDNQKVDALQFVKNKSK